MLRLISSKHFKLLMAAHHHVFHTTDVDMIAFIININPRTLRKWMSSDTWLECLEYWGREPSLGDFNKAKQSWFRLFETLQMEPVVDIPIISLEVK